MNLEEAIALYAATIRDLSQYEQVREERRKAKPHSYFDGYAGVEADELRVVTMDGKEFGLLWQEGAYSDHHVVEVWTVEEWQKANNSWRQETFNPDGGWAKRTVVDRDANEDGSVVDLRLNCGHKHRIWVPPFVRKIKATPLPPPPSTVICTDCRDAGYGLDVPDPMEVEGVTA